MGLWPKFQKCCWVLSLNIGILVIGYGIAVSNGLATVAYMIRIVYNVQQKQENNIDVGSIDYFAYIMFLLILIFGIILGIIIIIGRNKAKYLGTAVFLLAALTLLHLLAVIFHASHGVGYSVVIQAFSVLLSAYCILIVRSVQLQLQGRLTSTPIRRVHRQRLSEHELVHSTQSIPQPPPYDFNLTLPPTDEEANVVAAVNDNGIAVLPVEQSTINPGNSKDEKDIPIIFDVEQFNAVRNMQVVERVEVSTSVETR